LVVNIKTAKTLGLAIPPAVLLAPTTLSNKMGMSAYAKVKQLDRAALDPLAQGPTNDRATA